MSLNWNKYYANGADFAQLPEAMVDFIASLAGGDSPKTALDVGCGTGKLARQLSVRGFDVVGVDLADEAIRRAAEMDRTITYQIGDITSVNGVFSLVTCKHVYAFINDKPVFLAQVKSRLKPGGIFALLTPTLDRVISGKPGIAVDRVQLEKELSEFNVITRRELPSGLLIIAS